MTHPRSDPRSHPRPRRWPAALAVVLVLVGGCSASPDHRPDRPDDQPRPDRSTATPTDPSTRPTTKPRSRATSPTHRSLPPDSVAPASARQVAGLVRVVASIGDDGRGETSTGMLLSAGGEVLTNNHGVDGATAVQATVMSSGRTYLAQVVAADRGRDVALLRLTGAAGLAPVRLAARDAAVGDPVTVVGGAGGRHTFTAATGRVLALDQTLVTPTTRTARGERLTGVVLTSCDVVLGESGGPTYDLRGRVVGMTTAAVRTAQGRAGVSIPVEQLRSVVQALRR